MDFEVFVGILLGTLLGQAIFYFLFDRKQPSKLVDVPFPYHWKCTRDGCGFRVDAMNKEALGKAAKHHIERGLHGGSDILFR